MSLLVTRILNTVDEEMTMVLRCKDGDLAIIVGELPGCEANIGRIVQVRGPAEPDEQFGGLMVWVIRPISSKKMINLYTPNVLISERVTWKSNIKLADCWLIPIRPPQQDKGIVEKEHLPLKKDSSVAA
jgi:hypothetical protein